jgi:hypothetical protein
MLRCGAGAMLQFIAAHHLVHVRTNHVQICGGNEPDGGALQICIR